MWRLLAAITLLAIALLAALTASAAHLTVNGGTLQVFTFPVDLGPTLGTIEILKKEVETPGGQCEGGMDSITLELTAAPDQPVTVTVEDGKDRVLNFPGISIGHTFTIESPAPGQKFNKMNLNLTVVKDGTTLTKNLKVHVSCSDNPFIGQTDSKDDVIFTTVAWNSIDGGPAPAGPPVVIGPLAGATFSISPNPGSCAGQVAPFSVTDNGPNDVNPADGAIEVNDVCPATYEITETEPPSGFAPHPDPATCNVNASGSPSSSSPCTVTVSEGNLLASATFFNVALPPPKCIGGMDSITLELTAAPAEPVTVTVKDGKDRVLDFPGIWIGGTFTIESAVPGEKFNKANLELTVVKDGKTLTEKLNVHVSCSDHPVAGVTTDTKDGVTFTIMDFTSVGKDGKKDNPPEVAPPTPTPTPEPTATPTPEPTATPASQPTATPASEPTATPASQPTATPASEPTATPASEPTPTSQPEPSPTPTAASEPTATPASEPTATPTSEPTATPTPQLEPTQTPEA